jgi:hypothetical protein
MRHLSAPDLAPRLEATLPPEESRFLKAYSSWLTAGYALQRIATSRGKRDLPAWEHAAQVELKARARVQRAADRL